MSEEEIENYKIGMYTLGEIYNEMTNNMLQRSMTDAIRDKFYELEMQLQQKENKEKEIREYILSNLITEWDIKHGGYVSGSDLPVDAITPILEILDKEVN